VKIFILDKVVHGCMNLSCLVVQVLCPAGTSTCCSDFVFGFLHDDFRCIKDQELSVKVITHQEDASWWVLEW